MSVVPGSWLGPYEVIERIGSGGMGVVFKARDSRLERTVAIKLLAPDRTRDDLSKQRFLYEARTASALDHANICTVHEIDETPEGQLYLVMAYYDGETLASRIDRGPLDIQEALDIVIQVGAGLAEAHGAAVVHRDIKPANLLIGRSGRVKILDFGLAKLAGGGIATQTGMIAGTVAYMSPEQVQGDELDHRTDIWSLGVVWYEMLIGRRPFAGENLLSLSHAITHNEPEPVSRLRPNVPSQLDSVLARTLAKRRIDRYSSIAELVTDLTDAATAAGLQVRAPADLQSAATLATVTERRRSTTGTSRTRVPPSIAVLPFADMSPQKDQEYFCEGMAEELINALAGIEGLHVAARTSSFQFKARGADIGEIGRRLRVANILEGSVRKSGSKLRITAQLVKASDGYHLWSERYDRTMEDIFALQDEIAHTVVAQLKLQLLSDAAPLVKRHTENLTAYHAFLRGRHCRFSLYDLRGAVQFFEQAVAADPKYALAHAAVADCFNVLGLYAVLAPGPAAAKVKASLALALQHDDALPEATAALAQCTFLFDRDWAAADRLFRKAIDQKSGGVEIVCWYGYFLAATGRVDEGLEMVGRAAAIDPLSAYVSGYTATILYVARRFDEAIRRAQEALQIQPGFGLGLNTLALSYSAIGRHSEAVAPAEQLVAASQRSTHSLGLLGAMAGAAGQRGAALAALGELESRLGSGYVSPVSRAGVKLGLGDVDGALRAFEEAFAERTPTLHSLWFAQYDALRGDARWHDLARRLALPPYAAGAIGAST